MGSLVARIKEVLARIFPVPARSFFQHINAVKDELKKTRIDINDEKARNAQRYNDEKARNTQRYKEIKEEIKRLDVRERYLLLTNTQDRFAKDMKLKYEQLSKRMDDSFNTIGERFRSLQEGQRVLTNDMTSRIEHNLNESQHALTGEMSSGFKQINVGLNENARAMSESTRTLNKGHEMLTHTMSQKLDDIRTGVYSTRRITEKIDGDVNNAFRHVYYNHTSERAATQCFHEFRMRADYKECVQALLRGLDRQSRIDVIRILTRQERIQGTDGEKVDLFSAEEQKTIARVQKQVQDEVLKISDDCYCYEEFMLPIRHFQVAVVSDRHGVSRLKDIEGLKNKDILDVGGFIGDSLPIFAPMTQSKVYSFEADPNNFALLMQTIVLNGFDNVVPVNKALGDTDDVLKLYCAESCSSFVEPVDAAAETVDVTCMRLDTFEAEMQLDIGLIKVDIEGYEQAFLRGAKETICKHRPILLLSIYHNADDFFFIKPMIESWGLDYRFMIHKPIDYSISREVLLIAEPN